MRVLKSQIVSDLSKTLQTVKPGLKCIYMSGYTPNVIAHRGVIDKAIHFLQKPFSLQTLVKKVREVLDENTGNR